MRRRRVLVHLKDDGLPSVEGLLKRRWPEYHVAVPKLHQAVGGTPAELDSRVLVIPRANVAFYEIL